MGNGPGSDYWDEIGVDPPEDNDHDAHPGGSGPPPGVGPGSPDYHSEDKPDKPDKGEVKLNQPGTTTYSGGYGGGGGSYNPLVGEGKKVYFQLWGEPAPPGYIEALVKKGLNIWEIEDHERRKPSFRRTETYKNEFGQIAKLLSGLLGSR